jgi:hypothetical protein
VAGEPSVLPGWAELWLDEPEAGNSTTKISLNASAMRGRWRELFACPFEGACPGFALGAAPATRARCSPGYRGLLCAECADGFALTGRGCVACAAGESLHTEPPLYFLSINLNQSPSAPNSGDATGFGLLLLAGALAALALLWTAFAARGWLHCGGRVGGLVLFVGVAQRVWPRLKQSADILVANYQIVSRIPARVDAAGRPFRLASAEKPLLTDGHELSSRGHLTVSSADGII